MEINAALSWSLIWNNILNKFAIAFQLHTLYNSIENRFVLLSAAELLYDLLDSWIYASGAIYYVHYLSNYCFYEVSMVYTYGLFDSSNEYWIYKYLYACEQNLIGLIFLRFFSFKYWPIIRNCKFTNTYKTIWYNWIPALPALSDTIINN